MGQPVVRIDSEDFEALEELCKTTGHKLSFHIKRAISNYMNDEAPVWRQAAQDMQSKLQRKKK